MRLPNPCASPSSGGSAKPSMRSCSARRRSSRSARIASRPGMPLSYPLGGDAAPQRRGIRQRREPRLDLRAAILEERRQGELLPERLGGVVGGEAGAVGGQLEEDAAGLAEVERAEVVAVDPRRRAGLGRGREARAPFVLLAQADPPGDVMDRARALQRPGLRRRVADIEALTAL